MTLPNGVSTGQLLLATFAIQGSNPLANPWATIILPAGGWTEIAPSPRDCGGDLAMSVAWRIAQPSDTPGTQFTWGFLSNGFFTPLLASAGIVSIANVSITAPIDQITTLCTTQSTQVTAEPVSTVHNNSLNILVYGTTGDNFLSKPSGYSQVYQHIVFGVGPDITNDSKLITAAGTNTGSQISTASTVGDSIGLQISLAPAP